MVQMRCPSTTPLASLTSRAPYTSIKPGDATLEMMLLIEGRLRHILTRCFTPNDLLIGILSAGPSYT